MADFAPMPPPGELDETYTSSLILAHSLHYMKKTRRHSLNQIHNVSHCCQKRSKSRPEVTCTENLVKFGRVDFET